jgi:hypothetical protein
VARYLVVANQTLSSGELWAEIEKRLANDPEPYFYVVVPNTAAAHYHVVPAAGGFVPMPTMITGTIPETDEEATAQAHQLLTELLARISRRATAEGEVADPDPMEAAHAVLATRKFDEILVSTLPERASRWRRMDVPRRIERRFGLPVTAITAKL